MFHMVSVRVIASVRVSVTIRVRVRVSVRSFLCVGHGAGCVLWDRVRGCIVGIARGAFRYTEG